MTNQPDPDNNVIVKQEFTCPACGTVFVCNRAEPFCLTDHPGQWHLQGMRLAETPCPSCLTWVEPVRQYIDNADPNDDTIILYPPIEPKEDQ